MRKYTITKTWLTGLLIFVVGLIIGGVIYTMQYAGFQKIGFISEPVAGSGTLGRL